MGDTYYIYFLFDKDEIVYIGLSQDPERRIKAHNKSGKQFTSTKMMSLKYYQNKGLDIERQLIGMFKPKYNGDCITGRKSYSEALIKARKINKDK